MSLRGIAQVSHIGFLTLNNFSLIAFSNAIEVLRMANYLSGQELYQWSVMTPDGRPVVASNGLAFSPSATKQAKEVDLVFVCGGVDVQNAVDAAVIKTLRQYAKQEVSLGGICTGSYALAKAGLLDGYHCTIHWENLPSLSEDFPHISFLQELFVIDRDRYTCAGGIAPLDMMLAVVGARLGKRLVAEISDQFMVERARDGRDKQHIPVAARMGSSHKALVEVAALMESNIEEPLSLVELANLAGLSQRHLQRMFRHALGMSPMSYYLNLRLKRARTLLLQTEMSVMNITVACGFQSGCHFSKSYRAQFGYSPRDERRRHEQMVGDSPMGMVTSWA